MGVIPEASDLPPGSQPWKRSVDSRILALENNLTRGNQDMLNAINALSTTVKVLGDQIAALPIVKVMGDKDVNFGLTDVFKTVSQVTFQAPLTKKRAQLFVGVNASVLDMTSGGVTSAEGRINWGDVLLSPTFPAAKDAGASVVNNIISGTHFFNVNLIPGAYYSIRFELRGLSPTAFTQQAANYSAISIISTHTA